MKFRAMELEPHYTIVIKLFLISKRHKGNSVLADPVFFVYNVNPDFPCNRLGNFCLIV